MSRHAPRKSLGSATAIMAPSSAAGKRVKGKQVFRPFVYGTTARPFDPEKNPKPPGVPDDHTHSWTVFVKGVDDTDITYWLKRVQFKLHESIPQHVRMIDAVPGKPFVVNETGWGEFEIAIKMYYVPESGEKAQTLYHHLRLHPYGDATERAAMVANGEVPAWVYEEQLFNEPYEHFYDILTSGAVPSSDPNYAGYGLNPTNTKGKGGGAGKGKGAGGAGAGSTKEVQSKRSEGGVLERSAMIPMTTRPGHPFSAEAEALELKKLEEALKKVEKMKAELVEDNAQMQNKLLRLKNEAQEEAAKAA